MNVTEKLDELAQFNADPGEGQGITRSAFTPEAAAASRWLVEEMEALDMRTQIDPAGNIIGTWGPDDGKAVAIGSHFDSVPNGGVFDGALGVISALAAVDYLRSKQVKPVRPVMVLAFNSEEWQDCPMLGSLSFCGDFDVDYYRDRGIPEIMQGAGFDYEQLTGAAGIDKIEAFLELHIEQGPVLENAGTDIGVVTGMTGSHLFLARYKGEANHSGTTPLELRRDALLGAAEAITTIRKLGEQYQARTTVGTLRVSPGALNIIPGEVEFGIDIRAMDADALNALVEEVPRGLGEIAERHKLFMELDEMQHYEPTHFDKEITQLVRDAAAEAGLSFQDMPSGAGHDARNVARHDIPTGLIFIPSKNGVSHSPLEYSTPEECDRGTVVLQRVLERLVTE